MIETLEGSVSGPGLALRLRPNRSSSAQDLLAFFSALTLVAFGVAAFAATQGNVFAPAFALAHMAAVGLALRCAWRRLDRQEVIAVAPEAVTVRQEARGRRGEARFDPHWVRVERQPARHATERARLLLASHGRRVEIGAFLADEERALLEDRLKRALQAVRQGA